MPFSCMFNLGKTLLAGLSIIQSTTNRMKALDFSPTQTRLKTTIPSNRKRLRKAQKVSSVVRSEGVGSLRRVGKEELVWRAKEKAEAVPRG